MKVTRKNIGYYHIELSGRTFEASRIENGLLWSVGELLENGYGGFECKEYSETFDTPKECKEYVKRKLK